MFQVLAETVTILDLWRVEGQASATFVSPPAGFQTGRISSIFYVKTKESDTVAVAS